MSLTSAQKEEVAVLLGWRQCEMHPSWYVKDNPYECVDWPVTLEAMFAYCRERKWLPVVTAWDGPWEVDIYFKRDHGTDICGKDPDPVAAFALALLAAHKEASNG